MQDNPPRKDFYARVISRDEFRLISPPIGWFRCMYEQKPYTVIVRKYFVRDHPKMTQKNINCDLVQYHAHEKGADMGIIGTLTAISSFSELPAGICILGRKLVLLHIPSPTIFIKDEYTYQNCKINPGESFTTNFGYGEEKYETIENGEKVVVYTGKYVQHYIPREVGYLPTTVDRDNGIFGCTVAPGDYNPINNIAGPEGSFCHVDDKFRDDICNLLMGHQLEDNGEGFTHDPATHIQANEQNNVQFMNMVHYKLMSRMSNPRRKQDIIETEKNRIAAEKERHRIYHIRLAQQEREARARLGPIPHKKVHKSSSARASKSSTVSERVKVSKAAAKEAIKSSAENRRAALEKELGLENQNIALYRLNMLKSELMSKQSMSNPSGGGKTRKNIKRKRKPTLKNKRLIKTRRAN